MIFGRKKRQVEADAVADEDTQQKPGAVADPVDSDEAAEQDAHDAAAADDAGADTRENAEDTLSDGSRAEDSTADESDAEAGAEADGETDEIDVEALDAQEWRTQGPWDDTEVDQDQLTATEDARIDLGSLVVTGVDGMELQLQVAEDTQQIVSAMMIVGEQVDVDGEVHELNSALEVAAFAAPRSSGFWSEIREEVLDNARESGGSAGLTEGPFGVEVRRMMLLQTPEGEQGYQPSRMWVVEGPRWILRGVVYGHAALDGVPGDHVEHIADLFRQIVVRRGDDPMAPGDLLVLRLPENMEEEATEE